MNLSHAEHAARTWCRSHFLQFIRWALFTVYFFFGLLKVLGLSPATPLVHALFGVTLAPFMTFELFNPLFGVFEMFLGILFLLPRYFRFTLSLLVLHLVLTASPLVLLPQYAWSGFLVPTLEGQYILKNILIIACALVLLAHGDEK